MTNDSLPIVLTLYVIVGEIVIMFLILPHMNGHLYDCVDSYYFISGILTNVNLMIAS